jgi:hypothetical protein
MARLPTTTIQIWALLRKEVTLPETPTAAAAAAAAVTAAASSAASP